MYASSAAHDPVGLRRCNSAATGDGMAGLQLQLQADVPFQRGAGAPGPPACGCWRRPAKHPGSVLHIPGLQCAHHAELIRAPPSPHQHGRNDRVEGPLAGRHAVRMGTDPGRTRSPGAAADPTPKPGTTMAGAEALYWTGSGSPSCRPHRPWPGRSCRRDPCGRVRKTWARERSIRRARCAACRAPAAARASRASRGIRHLRVHIGEGELHRLDRQWCQSALSTRQSASSV